MSTAQEDTLPRKRTLLDHKKQSHVAKEFIAFASSRIAEQERAVLAVSRALERAYSGFRNPRKPAGTFLFLGPSGSGKTRLVQILAEYLFNNLDGFIRLDGQDYYDRHTVSRLIGAPMGYIGYDEDPKITQGKLDSPAFAMEIRRFLKNLSTEQKIELVRIQRKIRRTENQIQMVRQPGPGNTFQQQQIAEMEGELNALEAELQHMGFPVYNPDNDYSSILLLDEIGRAHESLRNIVFKILDEGVMELAAGGANHKQISASGPRLVSFRNCFIFATGNEGAGDIAKLLRTRGGSEVKMGFGGRDADSDDDINKQVYTICLDAAQKFFTVEFLNRWKEIIAFRPLTRKGFERVLDIEIDRLKDLLVNEWDFPITLKISKTAKRFIVNEATDKPEEQARLIGKKLEHYIIEKLAVFKLTAQIQKDDTVVVYFNHKNKELTFFKRSNDKKRKILHLTPRS